MRALEPRERPAISKTLSMCSDMMCRGAEVVLEAIWVMLRKVRVRSMIAIVSEERKRGRRQDAVINNHRGCHQAFALRFGSSNIRPRAIIFRTVKSDTYQPNDFLLG